MNTVGSLPWNSDDELEVLTFGLGGETFAVEAVLVREILDLLPATAVPGARPLVGNVINFRGRVIPLADLRPAFGMELAPATEDSRIIVLSIGLDDAVEPIGLRADRVEEVTIFTRGSCEAPPAIGIRWQRRHVRALVRHGEDVVVLPDFGAILAGDRQPASS